MGRPFGGGAGASLVFARVTGFSLHPGFFWEFGKENLRFGAVFLRVRMIRGRGKSASLVRDFLGGKKNP